LKLRRKRVAGAEKAREDEGAGPRARLESEWAREKEARKQAAKTIKALFERFIERRRRYIAVKVLCLHAGDQTYVHIVTDRRSAKRNAQQSPTARSSSSPERLSPVFHLCCVVRLRNVR
jgi:hypothetical protein